MSKEEKPDIRRYQHVNWAGGAPIYSEKEKRIDPHQANKNDLIEARKVNKNKSFFKKIQDKLLNNNNNIPFQQADNGQNQDELESIACHICGNICKEKDYFCAECGAKLKVGHYND